MNSGILKMQIAGHSKNLCTPHLSVRNTVLFKIFTIACPIHFIILLSHVCANKRWPHKGHIHGELYYCSLGNMVESLLKKIRTPG